MNEFRFGLKIYSSDWLTEYGLSPEKAAGLLKSWGVDFILAQSQYLSMPNSAVQSEAQTNGDIQYSKEIDRKFRNALKAVGIDYWITACTFFNPNAITAKPSLRPVGSDGKPMRQMDWYIGISPSMDSYVDEQVAQITDAVAALHPEGVFLSFTRWPGFWELWLPLYSREKFPEYSFDLYTLRRFEKDVGVSLPTYDPKNAAKWIQEKCHTEWVNWKCEVVEDVIKQVRTAAREIVPDVQIMLNTIPFRTSDFENARKEVFGQDLRRLKYVVDRFEVMTYHQILKRGTDWIPLAGLEVKEQSGRNTVCTIQASPLYLDGMHAGENRNRKMDIKEFKDAVERVEATGLDGVVVFTWSDLLSDFFNSGNLVKVEIINATIQRRNNRLM
jgi:hypothetical protein